MIKKYSLIIVACLCFIFSGFGQYTGTGSFTKITSISQLTDGYYVVAYEGTQTFAMNNIHNGTYLGKTDISPSGSAITDPEVAIVWKIEISGSAHTIYSEETSKFISYAGSGNNVQIVDAVITNNQRWNITYSSGKFTLTNAQLTNRKLQYNISSPRFACYTGSQQDVTLYKLAAPTGTTITVSPTTLTGFTYVEGSGPSGEQSFDVEGANLTADIEIATNTNYEISETSGTGFAGTITLPEGSGTVASTTIYVRLKAGLSAGTYNNDIITATSTDPDDVEVEVEVALEGTVYNTVDYSKLQWPQSGSITEGGSFTVYAKAYEPGVTTVSGDGSEITAWIGYNTTNNDPRGNASWTWIQVPYDSWEDGNTNYQYYGNLNENDLPSGTYYYAVRFQMGASAPYTYGGNNLNPGSNEGGNWDGSTYKNGTLTITSNVIGGGELIPDTATITEGNNTDIEVEFYDSGLTVGGGQGTPAPTVEIGISTADSNPSTWASGLWQAAFYTADNGNNDVYKVTTGSSLALGTYYYAARVKKQGSSTYTYIGKDWSTWNNNSGVLTVNNGIGWGNFQAPCTGTKTFQTEYNVYGRVWVNGVTPNSGHDSRIDAQVGYSTSDNDPRGAGWNWVDAQPNALQSGLGNNDEYMHNIGPDIPAAGTYYLAFRYKIDNKSWYYAGRDSGCDPDNSGGEWNGTTNINATFTVTAPSNTSDIIASTGFTYPTNISYINYQATNITGGSNDIEVAKFTIRDGGVAGTTDDLGTTLKNLTMSLSNSANVRLVAIYDGATEVAEQAGAATLNFTNLNLTAPDGTTKDFSVRVSFNTTVTDNKQIQFEITAATTEAASSTFAATNAGNAKSSIAGNDNRIKVVADRIAFTTQPTDTAINLPMSNVVVSATDVNGNIDLDISSGSVSITSTGTLTGDPISQNFTSGGTATFSGLVHTVAGSGFKLTASTTGFTSVESNTFNITTIVYVNGDYKSIDDGNWHSTTASGSANTWQQLVSGTWTAISTSPPSNAISLGTKKVYIQNEITLVGTNTAPNVIILNNGKLYTSTVQATFGNLTVKNNGEFYREANGSGIKSDGVFEIENGGTVYFKHTTTASRSSSIWQGIEKFHPNSNFIIITTDNTSNFQVIQNKDDVSEFNGACFGNLIIDQTAGNSNRLLPTGFNKTLTNNDLVFRNAINDLRFSSEPYSTTINGNLIIESTYSGRKINLSSSNTGTSNLTIKGNIIHNGNDNLNLSTTVGGTMNLNLEGNLVLGASAKLTSTQVTNSFNFTGTGDGLTPEKTQTIDVVNQGTTEKITFNINSGAYVHLMNQNFALGTSSSFTVKNGGTLDFGFNGSDLPLNLIAVTGQTLQKFELKDGGTLKITSPEGITTGGTNIGNVQIGSIPNRTYGLNANYHYIGKPYTISTYDQVSGNGLPSAASSKNVIVEMDSNDLTFQSSVVTRFNATGLLEIRKGIVVDEPNKNFQNGINPGENGDLTMSGGRYRLLTTGTQPDLSGDYSLTGGVIEYGYITPIGQSTDQSIRGGSAYQYPAIEVTGKDVYHRSANINLKSDGFLTLKSNARLTSTTNLEQIVSLSDAQKATLTIESNAIFRTASVEGFYGPIAAFGVPSASVRNNVILSLISGSTVEYARETGLLPITATDGNQTITEQLLGTAPNQYSYQNLVLSGTGIKTLGHDTDIVVNENLTVTGSAILPVINDQVITVRDAVFVDDNTAEFNISGNGQLIQVNDVTTNNNNGKIKLSRTANILRTDYVYWSSPVENFLIENVSPGTPNGYKFRWIPTKFQGIGPPGNLVFGDWETNNTGTMLAGKGYIIRGSNSISNDGNPHDFTATFTERPNNGIIKQQISWGSYNGANYSYNPNGVVLTVTRDDDNWNLIGNPYPSALDAEEFLAVNDNIEGAVHIWTHGTEISDDENIDNTFYDSFTYNYDPNDYLTYNSTGANPDPHFGGYIASGQGFFVRANDSNTAGSDDVIFNNTMRSKFLDNSEFYRQASTNNNPVEKHRIWLSLIAPNESSVTTLVGYVEGATIEKDRLYDAATMEANALTIFSLIDGDRMTIQGRPVPFDSDDQVPLGIIAPTAGIYTMAIKGVDGLFLDENQNIFLEDTYTDVIYNIRAAPYMFTVNEPTTFEDRFILRYTNSTLGIPDAIAETNLTVIELPNGNVKFTVASHLVIRSVEIIDMLGRTLYQLKGNHSSEVYELSNLSQAAYMAKVTLSNGQVLVKKAVKRK